MEQFIKKLKREVLRPFKRKTQSKKMTFEEIENDRESYVRLNQDKRFMMNRAYDYICKYDKYAPNANFMDSGYFIQDIWGARKVLENTPKLHYDVGSSVAGFIAHLLAQKQKVVLLDIRPINNQFNTKFLNGGGGYNLYSS